ncbi:MAG: hypothetical protein KKD44_28550 [Proteobacteria bacterium]|nr:hypothetical protein [Pseudomonadota bacterium]
MNKLIIIIACIAGILGVLDILKSDPLKYGAIAFLGYTAFITLGELSPPKGQGQVVRQSTQSQTREKPKDIWGEFGTEKEIDINAKQDKIQNPAEVQEAR